MGVQNHFVPLWHWGSSTRTAEVQGKCSAESFGSALRGSEAFGVQPQRRCSLGSLGGLGWGRPGAAGPAGRLGPDLAHSCGTQCQVTACLEGDQGHTSDRIRAGRVMHPGWQGRRENSPFPAAEREETGDSRGSLPEVPWRLQCTLLDSSRISYSALGLLLLLTGEPAAWSALVSRCTRSRAGLAELPYSLFPRQGRTAELCGSTAEQGTHILEHLTEKLTRLMPYNCIIGVVERGIIWTKNKHSLNSTKFALEPLH